MLIITYLILQPTLVNKTVDVVVTQKAFVSILPEKLFYNADSTPIVNLITPNKLNVLGGDNILITGINLPLWPEIILIGNQKVVVSNSTTNQITISSPSLKPGLYDLIIPIDNIGNAKLVY